MRAFSEVGETGPVIPELLPEGQNLAPRREFRINNAFVDTAQYVQGGFGNFSRQVADGQPRHILEFFRFQRFRLAMKAGGFEIKHQQGFAFFQFVPVQYVYETQIFGLDVNTRFFGSLPGEGFARKFVLLHIPANERKAPTVLFGLPEKKHFAILFQNEPHRENEHGLSAGLNEDISCVAERYKQAPKVQMKLL